MIYICNKPSLYGSDKPIEQGTLLIGTSTEHGLTERRVYVATRKQGEGTFHDCIFVINDDGIEKDYSSEWFALYGGERVICNR